VGVWEWWSFRSRPWVSFQGSLGGKPSASPGPLVRVNVPTYRQIKEGDNKTLALTLGWPPLQSFFAVIFSNQMGKVKVGQLLTSPECMQFIK
jgi:hypothetical protein